MRNAVITSIALPPHAKIARAGLSLVKSDGRWWVVPAANPSFREGDGFKTKAEAQKKALAIVRLLQAPASSETKP